MSLAAATLGAGFLNTAGNVYANAINSATQQRINDQNAQLQWAINADQIEAARMNNETAINLANTAHQREVMDLRDANLNPILSANGSGASVPSLDTPGLEAPQMAAPTITNPVSGLASSLATAVQVNDAHKLNDARLMMMGLPMDSFERHKLTEALANRTVAQVQSATEEAKAQRERSECERIRNELERSVLSDIAGYYMSDTGKMVRIPDPSVMKLVREGIMSDLKVRANQNLRQGINSAVSVGKAASDIGNTVKGFIKK